MRLILALALLSTTAATAREPARPLATPDCRAPNAQQVRTPPVAGPQRLDQLPDASLFRAVDYREGGCPKPIKVNRTVRR